MKEKYQNSEMQSLRYKENRKAVSERRQEQTSATLYRKISDFGDAELEIQGKP